VACVNALSLTAGDVFLVGLVEEVDGDEDQDESRRQFSNLEDLFPSGREYAHCSEAANDDSVSEVETGRLEVDE